MTEHTRREILTAAGGVVVGGAGIDTASADSHESDAFDNVTISYDETLLRRYQPRTVLDPNAVDRFKFTLGYVAESDEYDTTALCYVSRFTHQEGLTGLDSHLGNTVPQYVFLEEDGQQPVEVVWNGWHWNAAAISGEAAPLSEDRVDGSATHISFESVYPWENLVLADASDGIFLELKDWQDRRSYLIEDNGLYNRGAAKAFEKPWVMGSEAVGGEARQGWWSATQAVKLGVLPEINVDLVTMQLWELLGARGFDERSAELR